MANILGSMLAGAVGGGAEANMRSLLDKAKQKRKLSYAKIQQQYATDNINMSNDLAIDRDKVNRTNARLDSESLHKMRQSDEVLNNETRHQNRLDEMQFGVDNREPQQPSTYDRKVKLADEALSRGEITQQEYNQAIYGVSETGQSADKVPAAVQKMLYEKAVLMAKDAADKKGGLWDSDSDYPGGQVQWTNNKTMEIYRQLLGQATQQSTRKPILGQQSTADDENQQQGKTKTVDAVQNILDVIGGKTTETQTADAPVNDMPDQPKGKPILRNAPELEEETEIPQQAEEDVKAQAEQKERELAMEISKLEASGKPVPEEMLTALSDLQEARRGGFAGSIIEAIRTAMTYTPSATAQRRAATASR